MIDPFESYNRQDFIEHIRACDITVTELYARINQLCGDLKELTRIGEKVVEEARETNYHPAEVSWNVLCPLDNALQKARKRTDCE